MAHRAWPAGSLDCGDAASEIVAGEDRGVSGAWWPLIQPRVPLPWYTPLTEYLAEFGPSRGDEVRLSLREIREMVRGRLPKGAVSRRWWTRRNQRTPREVLREAGWEVADVEESPDEGGIPSVTAVRFARITINPLALPGPEAAEQTRPPAVRTDDVESEDTPPCPSCGGQTRLSPVPCPDGRWGCLVLHLAQRCPTCDSAP